MTTRALCIALCAASCSAATPVGDDSTPLDTTAATGEMVEVPSFGDNPGALNLYSYVPSGLAAGAPLVVTLHGCTQGAMDAVPAGWNELADEFGFAVAYAEQSADNNPVRCFNWAGEYGDPANMVRGQGENQSIKSMVDYMVDTYDLDPNRIYISGFSAGGAFAAVMLATWPDVFAAGAIQSGVPYHCAQSVQGAYDCQQMNQHPERKKSADEWGALVRDAYPSYSGPYPRVSIWHGMNDTFIVSFENQAELVAQWTNVHGIDSTPASTEDVAGHEHATYGTGNSVLVESYKIAGMGHAVAYGQDDPDHGCSPATFAQYYEDKGICSTYHVAQFFGLTGSAGGEEPCRGDECSTPDDSGPPTVAITSPGEGDLVAGLVTISASASDDSSIDGVEFYVDGALQGTDRSEPYSFDWPTGPFGEGRHELMAMARDTAGNVAVDQIDVEVDNDGNGAESDGFSGCSSTSSSGSLWLALALAAIVRIGSRRSRRRRCR